MSTYSKNSPGERLTYPARNLDKYRGEQFCLRITPGNIDLDRCFFVYLDELYEGLSIRELFYTYFVTPRSDRVKEMDAWLAPWLRLDPMLPKKYMLLQQMAGRVLSQSGKVLFHINHGPCPVNPSETVRDHLGTSVFSDGSFDDKILDIVLECDTGMNYFPEMVQWSHFFPTSTAGVKGPGDVVKRRTFMTRMVVAVVAIITVPFLLFSCNWNDPNRGGGGFNGGML